MISLELYVLVLLGISGVSMYFIVGVLIKQVRLLKAPFEQAELYNEQTRKILVHFKYILFMISLTILIMGLIPVGINILTFLVETGRPLVVKPISFIYSTSVHLQALILSYLVSRLYQLAGSEKAFTDLAQKHIEDELNNRP